MLAQAQAKGAKNLLVGDGLHLPFPDASFDALTIAWGLRNFEDRLAGLRENAPRAAPRRPRLCARVLAPARVARAALLLVHARHHAEVRPVHHPERGAYEYLADSIRAFPSQPTLAQMMRNAGFSAASWTNLALGIVAIHVAEV